MKHKTCSRGKNCVTGNPKQGLDQFRSPKRKNGYTKQCLQCRMAYSAWRKERDLAGPQLTGKLKNPTDTELNNYSPRRLTGSGVEFRPMALGPGRCLVQIETGSGILSKDEQFLEMGKLKLFTDPITGLVVRKLAQNIKENEICLTLQ